MDTAHAIYYDLRAYEKVTGSAHVHLACHGLKRTVVISSESIIQKQ